MYVCLYFVCMHVCMGVCRYVGMYVCKYACMYVWMYGCMYLCMYVCMCICLYVCMFVCIYVCMYVCTYVCMYVCRSVGRWVGGSVGRGCVCHDWSIGWSQDLHIRSWTRAKVFFCPRFLVSAQMELCSAICRCVEAILLTLAWTTCRTVPRSLDQLRSGSPPNNKTPCSKNAQGPSH